FQAIRRICDETGILLILDEVQAGMGRTGKLWGYENLGIEPDIFTSAKGLGGGIPIGAMMCKQHCDVFAPGDHASTFGGNPFACAVALTVCETLAKENLLENVSARGEQLRTGLRALAAKYPALITDVRGWGLINGMELAAESEITAADVVKAAIAEGLLLVPAGAKVLRFVPPLIVTETEVNLALQALETAIAAVQA
ncbi:aminotransferase class III-fold pyridoxal phosphate-dependent enzyme, partial [Chroococcidiopsidales cyanobacterium LEGE 13417]|nr:aminotransferase class III-fold pyridoxal phosphate-dependent enzyme [Chroococcidiopsidales cyanobacterium LEGE 13417]